MHHKTTNETIELLQSSNNGLTAHEAQKRLALQGENKLPEGKKKSFVVRFLLQFNNVLIYVLLGSAVITAVMRHFIDMGVILAVVVINAVIGYIQEDKAQKALDSIKNLLSLKAVVVRGGLRQEIGAQTLVEGDIALLKAGDKVPADMRLLAANGLEIDEAPLTGESATVEKSILPVDKNTVLSERVCMVYAGTSIKTGDATGIVTATGANTEVGKINTMLRQTKTAVTPLMKKMNSLSKSLVIIILSLSALLIVYGGLATNLGWGGATLAVIGLAVAMIPEGLPATLTIVLAIGVQRMSKRNAIVRRLFSVETLGSVTVICSDKTGTLTKNEMTATNIYTWVGDFEIAGTGYAPQGDITLNGKKTGLENLTLQRIASGSFLCNESDVFNDESGKWLPVGAPTEAALKVLAYKTEFDGAGVKKLNDIPFDSVYKYRATLVEDGGKRFIFVNGAPDRLLARCNSQCENGNIGELNLQFWDAKIELAASKGQRLIGLAFKVVEADKQALSHDDLNENMVFLGVVGIIDPPRTEALEAIKKCLSAGITVKMITGDHVLTAKEIGRQMGLTTRLNAVSGAELEQMSDDEIKKAAAECDIFARTSPQHKLRLVKALQQSGEIVAMTGDGVNDAPALKKADIGVAMGIKGTEVTKDAAGMVLLDDNFASIVSAVEEGRTVYDNILKTLLFVLPVSLAQGMAILIAILFNFANLPITAVQTLWVNMVVAVTLCAALAFEPTEKDIMQRPPRPTNEKLVGGYFIFRIAYVAAIITAIALLFFFFSKNFVSFSDPEHLLRYQRTVAVNALVFGQLLYLFNCTKIKSSIFSKDFGKNKVLFLVCGILILLQIAFTYLPFMQAWFGLVPIGFVEWLLFLAGGIVVLLFVEFEKFVKRQLKKRHK
jgi:magnesium-transporting ATPase (P-type)